jgi:hypothetical protein
MNGLKVESKKYSEMKFEPTYNYGDTDLTIDQNLIYWKFGELVKNLVTLSSSAERQAEIIGIDLL